MSDIHLNILLAVFFSLSISIAGCGGDALLDDGELGPSNQSDDSETKDTTAETEPAPSDTDENWDSDNNNGEDIFDVDSSSETLETKDANDVDATPAPSGRLTVEVLTENGFPLANADVSLRDQTAQTNTAGEITFDNLETGAATVVAEAEGHAPGSGNVEIEQQVTKATLRLGETTQTDPVDPTTPSTFQLGRFEIELPAGAVVNSRDNPVQDEIVAEIAGYGTEGTDFVGPGPIWVGPGPIWSMPSGEGQTHFSQIMMTSITLKDSETGRPLSVSSEAQATINYRLPESIGQAYSVGATVPAGWFDLQEAQWKQMSSGQIVSNGQGEKIWRANIDHFSWWNSMVPWEDETCLSVRVEDSSGEPISNATVSARKPNGLGYSDGKTSETGETCLPTRQNASLQVSAQHDKFVEQINSPTVSTPGKTSSEPAGQCDEQAGSCAEATIQLARGTCIEGQILDSSESPIEDMTVAGVVIEGAHRGQMRKVKTDEAGKYCMQVPRGEQIQVAGYPVDGERTESKVVNSNESDIKTCTDSSTECQSLDPIILSQ